MQSPDENYDQRTNNAFELIYGDDSITDEYSKNLADHLPDGIKREMFMPYRHSDLARLLIRHFDLNDADSHAFFQFCECLKTRFHIEHISELLEAEDLYEPFDPESQVSELSLRTLDNGTDNAELFFEKLRQLLSAAHYVKLDRKVLQTAIDLGNDWGIRLLVDWERIEFLEVFVRGYRTTTKSRRRWQHLFLREEIEFPIFKRMVIAFKMKRVQSSDRGLQTDRVYLKSFKDIPETDVELLLPGTQVRLTLIDRGLIILPSLPGMAVTVYKVLRGAILFTVAASIGKLLGWTIMIAAIGGYIAKSVMSYFRTKQKYQYGLTKNLMTRNLDNNAGVLYRLFNEAEEQELCESILAYYFLWRRNGSAKIDTAELDYRVELFLQRTTGIDIDFDVDDALRKLERFGIARRDKQGAWTVDGVFDSPLKLRASIQKVLPDVQCDSVKPDNSNGESTVLPLSRFKHQG